MSERDKSKVDDFKNLNIEELKDINIYIHYYDHAYTLIIENREVEILNREIAEWQAEEMEKHGIPINYQYDDEPEPFADFYTVQEQQNKGKWNN